jgi:hypothetical protein
VTLFGEIGEKEGELVNAGALERPRNQLFSALQGEISVD